MKGGGGRSAERRADGSAKASVVRFVMSVGSGLLLATAGLLWAQEGAPQRVEIAFSPHGLILWERGGQPVVVVEPQSGDGWITLARRYLEDGAGAKALQRANQGLAAPQRGRAVRIPVAALRQDLRVEAVRRLFPVDGRTSDGWQHSVLDPFGGEEESWGWLAELFSGSSGQAAPLRRANPGLTAANPPRAARVIVPEPLLLPAFRALEPVATPTPAAPSAPPVPAVPVQAAAVESLGYGADELGEYAVYRLKKGEALYSAVVVRFTGQLLAPQVNDTAMEIARRSGIGDVTDIPVGYPVKVPFDLLLPEYLPPENPRRQAWLENRRELGRFLEIAQAADLSGVHIVLDAGHGGRDTGAVAGGIWEATYAYDIMCRIRANLERHTRATVWTTIEHGRIGLTPSSVDRLEQRREAFLLTRPRYNLEDSELGVNLRWYLANDIILNRLGPGFPRSKTVFLSVHADSLHPSVRGAMVYVPARDLRPSAPYTVRHPDIARYAEYRNHPTVRLGDEFKARAEASSRHFAQSIVSSLGSHGIGVHPYQPVRDRVLRGRRSWVPAVLRYSAAQNAVLLECCNMANPEDRALLLRLDWRERFARAVVEGMGAAFAR